MTIDDTVLMYEWIIRILLYGAGLIALVGVVRFVGRRRGDYPQCVRCSYNLTNRHSDQTVCPECGADFTPLTSIVVGGRRWRWRTLAVTCVLCALFLTGTAAARSIQKQTSAIPETFAAAIVHGDLETFHYLVRRYPELATKTMHPIFGTSPLIIAVEHGRPKMVHTLLDAGADPDRVDGMGFTPLFQAVLYATTTHDPPWAVHDRDHEQHDAITGEMAQALVDAGANVDLIIPMQLTALLQAAQLDCIPAGNHLTAILLDAGADPDLTTTRNFPPIHWAILKGDAQRVQLFVDAGADPTLADTRSITPLERAREKGDPAIIQVIETALARQPADGTTQSRPRSGGL